jgi:type II secretory pathway predicted ATPase ExeA
MYEEYFGLERPPFKITPDTSLFFEGGKRGDILAALVYAVHRGEGIIKVVGEVGSGKTMLCRMLQLKLPATVEIVYIANPSVSAEDILFVVAHELSLPVERDASKHQVIRLLQDYLLQRHMENKQVVLFIEEAQGMPLDTLEEIRLLSNLETDENKLLQIILFGQPELDQNLSVRSIRQLRERITHNFELEPLTQEEIHNYLNFRMRQVGYTGPELVTNNLARKIEQHSEGLLRRINIIADKILLSAFAEGTHNLGPKHVTAAVNDSAFAQEGPRRSSSLRWGLMLLVAIVCALAIYQTRSQWMAYVSLDLLTKQESSLAPESPAAAEAIAEPVSEIENHASDTDTAAALVDAEIAAAQALEDADSQSKEEAFAAAEPVDVESSAQPAAAEIAADADVATPQVSMPDVAMAGESPQPAILTDQVAHQVTPVEVNKPQTGVSEQAEPVIAQVKQGSSAKSLPQPMLTSASQNGTGDTDSLSDDVQWLNDKLEYSRYWLNQIARGKMSVQVMMRNKSGARELVYYLRNEWALDLSKTYLYEVLNEGRTIYRVFYGQYDSLSEARAQIEVLPESVKVNSPYVHSVHRMREALL